jgi:hypothetical protein
VADGKTSAACVWEEHACASLLPNIEVIGPGERLQIFALFVLDLTIPLLLY